ncbi:hypothetical protein DY000_02052634 [Brassica cretica]|uniref:Uncharacterized protein n=1 Tax=Brassica cretica TaxID=69181 RepID=A0ABQ7A7W1_BRACR|nr:hypothetical protein DY000_02052634 [Brassica cretica]
MKNRATLDNEADSLLELEWTKKVWKLVQGALALGSNLEKRGCECCTLSEMWGARNRLAPYSPLPFCKRSLDRSSSTSYACVQSIPNPEGSLDCRLSPHRNRKRSPMGYGSPPRNRTITLLFRSRRFNRLSQNSIVCSIISVSCSKISSSLPPPLNLNIQESVGETVQDSKGVLLVTGVVNVPVAIKMCCRILGQRCNLLQAFEPLGDVEANEEEEACLCRRVHLLEKWFCLSQEDKDETFGTQTL